MIMAILGLLAPFIPDVLGIGKQWIDHKQELAMLALRHEQAKEAHGWRLEEIHTEADIAEMKAIRKPHESYGVKLLDKAANAEGLLWRWAFNVVFIAFAWLDIVISSVRPGITYWAFGLYTIVKSAGLYAAYTASVKWSDGTLDALSKTFLNEAAWTQFDQEILTLIVAFWFGDRARRRSKLHG